MPGGGERYNKSCDSDRKRGTEDENDQRDKPRMGIGGKVRLFCAPCLSWAGYLVLGMGFGILLETNGYGVWWAFFMSLFIYAGSMQYVAIDLLAGGASLLSARADDGDGKRQTSFLRRVHDRAVQRYGEGKTLSDFCPYG